MKRFILFISILFLGLAYVTNAQTTVSLPDTNVAVGPTTLNIPITVQNFNNVGAISLTISYNAAVLDFQGIENSAAAGFSVNESNGNIILGWFSPDGVTPISIPSNGKLLDLKFNYTNGSSNLNFVTTNGRCEISSLTSAIIPTTFTSGQVSSPVRISLDHVKASVGDTVSVPLRAFNMVNAGAISLQIDYDNTVLQFLGLENDAVGFTQVNAAGGKLTMGWFSNNNQGLDIVDGVMANLRFVFNGDASNLSFFTFDGASEISDIDLNIIDAEFISGSVTTNRNVSLPTLEANPNTSVSFPLTVTNLSVGSANIDLLYDPAVLTFTQLTNSAGDGATANVVSPGRLRIGYFDSNPDTSTGTLFNLEFTFTGDSSGLTFDLAQTSITDELGSFYTGYDIVNGFIRVIQATAPVFTAELPDTTIFEGQNLSFTYTATDADGDTLSFSLVAPPAGAAIDSASGLFTWTPGFDQAGTHEIIAVVSDGVLTDTSRTSLVIVADSNRTLAFTAVMPNTTVQETDTLTFDYDASDPDSVAVTYALVTPAPAGAAIDAATGILTWVPTFDQAGTYNIIVSASDGVNTIVDTAVVTVTNRNRNPVFVNVLDRDSVLYPNPGNFTFQYTATDPDSDPVFFSLLGTESKATISSDGLLTYTANDTLDIDTLTVVVRDAFGGADTTVTILSSIDAIIPRVGLPTEFALNQNFPNPFNPSTMIQFQLPKESHVTLKVYNLLGEQVYSVVNEVLPAGYHEYSFNAVNMSSGIYIYRIQAGDFVSTKKMTLIK